MWTASSSQGILQRFDQIASAHIPAVAGSSADRAAHASSFARIALSRHCPDARCLERDLPSQRGVPQ